MIYIENIKVIKDFFGNLTKGFNFDCKDLNLIVGDQGCGKSTLLHLLQTNGLQHNVQYLAFKLNPTLSENSVKSIYFDSEKENPRIKDIRMVAGDMIGYTLASYFGSHGEALVNVNVHNIAKMKDTIIFLDEPESALSVRNQLALVKALNQAVKQNCQVFIATHCYPLIFATSEVFSLEHKKWMTSSEFLESQKLPLNDLRENFDNQLRLNKPKSKKSNSNKLEPAKSRLDRHNL